MLRVYSQYTNGASVCVHCLFSWLHIMNACWNWFLHIIAKIDRYWLELASFSLSTPMFIVCGCFVLVFLQYDPNIDSAPISCRHTQQALWKSAIWHMHRTYVYAVRLFNMQMTFSISTPNSQVCVCAYAREWTRALKMHIPQHTCIQLAYQIFKSRRFVAYACFMNLMNVVWINNELN